MHCGEDCETSSYCPVHCPNYLQERMTLLNTIGRIDPHIFDLNNVLLIEILLYGKENLYKMNNNTILDAATKYLIEAKRFDTQLFYALWMSFALMLLLKLLFVVSLVCFLLLGYIYLIFLYIYIFYLIFFPCIPRYIATYICISGGCKF